MTTNEQSRLTDYSLFIFILSTINSISSKFVFLLFSYFLFNPTVLHIGCSWCRYMFVGCIYRQAKFIFWFQIHDIANLSKWGGPHLLFFPITSSSAFVTNFNKILISECTK